MAQHSIITEVFERFEACGTGRRADSTRLLETEHSKTKQKECADLKHEITADNFFAEIRAAYTPQALRGAEMAER
jgi:hypothetical protein